LPVILVVEDGIVDEEAYDWKLAAGRTAQNWIVTQKSAPMAICGSA
jgi:hypothetical protein